MKATRLVVVLAIFLTQGVFLVAQSAPNLENGFKPYGSYDGSNLDSVNLMDSNLLMHVSLDPHAAQRGKLGPELLLYLTSQNWTGHCDTLQGGNCYWQYGG